MSNKTNKMLIDATHPEETRVVVVKDGRVEEFDFESASRKPLRGNIYLAKITRVEPSLQAAFVEYGGNRHGFLAFNEIHPDYYQIPHSDRVALLEEEAAQEAAEEAEADAHAERLARRRGEGRDGDRDGDGDRREARGEREGRGGDGRGERDGRGGRDRRTGRRNRGRGQRPGQGQGQGQAPGLGSQSGQGQPRLGSSEPRQMQDGDTRAEFTTADDGSVVAATIAADLSADTDAQMSGAFDHGAVNQTEASSSVPATGATDNDHVVGGIDASATETATFDTAPAPHAGGETLVHRTMPIRTERSGDVIREDDPTVFDAPSTEADLQPIGHASDATDAERSSDRASAAANDDEPRAVEARRARGDDADMADDAYSDSDSDQDADDDEDDDNDDTGGDSDGLVQVKSEPVEIDVIEPEGSEDIVEDVLPQRPRRRMRSYKIQEVIKRRQIVLIQVVKEERGNKGAALTTYLSLAGRYTVLMPNTARGGGISRKITNPADRKRLKSAAQELDVPEGMGLIVRTAGAARTGQEIKRDFEYLLRLWESVRDLTLQSTAPMLVYEEGNLIKRSIRDLYNKDIEEIVVAGEAGFREAQGFMRMLAPTLARSVVHYQGHEPLLARYRVEQQLAALFSPQVTLKSGGYIVINQTEALVAIDVNSGKSTREYSIEETALNTNLEAADEVARQVKLRDLAGLIVIDFIDMEEKRNNRAVERRLKDALRHDRARIQLGRISHFGLMEMSRQRLRTGVVEGSSSQCPHCQGSGIVRSIESISLAVLRGIEDALMSGTRMAITATTTPQVALYILNSKRGYIVDMEARHGLPISVQGSDKLQGANFTIDKVAATAEPVRRRAVASPVNMEWGFDGEAGDEPELLDAEIDEVDGPDAGDGAEGTEKRAQDDQGGEGGRRRRRRRGRRGRRGETGTGEQGLGTDDYGTQPVGGYDGEGAEHLSAHVGGEIEEVGGDDDDADDFDGDGDGARADGGSSPRGPAARNGEGDSEDGDRRGRRRRRGRRGGRRGNGEGGDDRPVVVVEGHGAPVTVGMAGPIIGGEIAYLEDGSRATPVMALGHGEPVVDVHPVAPVEAEAAPHRRGRRPRAEVAEPVAVAADAIADAPTAVTEAVVAAAAEPVVVAAVQAAVVEPVAEPVKPVVEPVAEVVAEPAKPRRTSTSSEPILERVVLGTDGNPVGAEPVAVAEEAKPTRRGWWQKRS